MSRYNKPQKYVPHNVHKTYMCMKILKKNLVDSIAGMLDPLKRLIDISIEKHLYVAWRRIMMLNADDYGVGHQKK